MADGKPCQVLRGGGWTSARGSLRASSRNREVPASRNDTLGFRCAADCPWEPARQKTEVRSQKPEGKAEEKAESKRKVKPPGTVLCKPGKLLFEDDFSGEKLEWETRNEWTLHKGVLLTTAVGRGNASPGVMKSFEGTRDAVVELRVMSPCNVGSMTVGLERTQSAVFPRAQIIFERGKFGFHYHDFENNKSVTLATQEFPYPKPRWVHVVYELVGKRHALTLDRRTVTYESPEPVEDRRSLLILTVYKTQPGPFAVDDVRVWEALPK